MLNVEKYLERINFKGSLTPSSSLLKEIHQKHIEYVPFENINNYLEIPVSLNLNTLYEKIVLSNRGGYCYELNGLFHQLLLNLGFDARLLAAKLYDDEILLDHSLHAVIHVNVENQDWLLDVGYGSDGQLYPLMITEEVQMQKSNLYKVSKNVHEIVLSRFKEKNDWHKLMKISLDEVELSFFHLRNLYHQEDSGSMFKQHFMCSIYSSQFVKSIKNRVYSFTQADEIFFQTIKNDVEFLKILENDFAIKISKRMAQVFATKCLKA